MIDILSRRSVSALRSLVDPAIKKALKTKKVAKADGDFLTFLSDIHLPGGKPYSFEGHEYLRAIAEDKSRHQVIRKAAQVGASTLKAIELLYYAQKGRNVGYYMPTKPLAEDFVRWTVNPVINNTTRLLRSVVEADKKENEEEELKRRGKAADTVRHIQFNGGGNAFFRYLSRASHAKAVPLDALFMDEVAELARQRDPDLGIELMSFLQDRLLHSDLKLVREFSQPGVPLMDIDLAFHSGDQKFYLHKHGCGQWICFEESFPSSLAASDGSGFIPLSEMSYGQLQIALDDGWDFSLFCPYCHRPAPAGNLKAEWVARTPSRKDISSFSISQLYAHPTPREIAARWLKAMRSFSEMVTFTISVLGLPHAGDRQPLTEEDLMKACEERSPEFSSSGTHFAGIDCGDLYHIVISRLDGDCVRVVWAEHTEYPDRLLSLLQHFNARFIVDAMPYKPISKKLVRQHGGGRMGAILYSNVQATSYSVEDEDTEPVRVVKVNRNEMIDSLVDDIKAGFLRLPSPSLPITREIFEHCKKLIRDRNEDGSWTYRRGVENHYAMAMAMMMVGVREQTPLRLGPPPRLRDLDAAMAGDTIVGALGGVY